VWHSSFSPVPYRYMHFTTDIMASASSSAISGGTSFACPVALVVSDQELSNEGHLVVSSCVLRKYFGYHGISRDRLPVCQQFPSGDLLPVTAPSLAHVIENFSAFTHEQYVEIARAHSIQVIAVDRKDYIRDLLCVHHCTAHCAPNLLVYWHLRVPRCNFAHVVLLNPFSFDHFALRTAAQRASRQHRKAQQVDQVDSDPIVIDQLTDDDTDDDLDFPTVRTFAEKVDIIKEWHHSMSSGMQQRGACAVCAHNVCIKELKSVSSCKVPLHLLRNDCLPAHTLPQSYDFELYDRAILYPKGLSNCWALEDLHMCHQCYAALINKHPRQPISSLANFQYYGHERLPSSVADAFMRASTYDLMLVSHARCPA
jgi:hypothetical protein